MSGSRHEGQNIKEMSSKNIWGSSRLDGIRVSLFVKFVWLHDTKFEVTKGGDDEKLSPPGCHTV